MTSPRTVRIATRSSPLALWQAEDVASRLRAIANVSVEIVRVSTQGDRRLDVPLADIGGKGVFVSEVQASVLDASADIAVHSAKDMPAVERDDLAIAAFLPRADPRDAVVGSALSSLGHGAVVATGSPRRRAQLLDAFPHLTIVELRGNIATRLSKVGSPAAGAPDGATVSSVIVAAAALDRLEQSHLAVEYLDPTRFIPQVGQGIVAVECRRDDDELVTLLGRINDPISQRCAVAERAFLAELGGDCRLPAAAHASVTASGMLLLRAMLTSGDGGPVETVRSEGDDPAALGTQAAQELLRRMP